MMGNLNNQQQETINKVKDIVKGAFALLVLCPILALSLILLSSIFNPNVIPNIGRIVQELTKEVEVPASATYPQDHSLEATKAQIAEIEDNTKTSFNYDRDSANISETTTNNLLKMASGKSSGIETNNLNTVE